MTKTEMLAAFDLVSKAKSKLQTNRVAKFSEAGVSQSDGVSEIYVRGEFGITGIMDVSEVVSYLKKQKSETVEIEDSEQAVVFKCGRSKLEVSKVSDPNLFLGEHDFNKYAGLAMVTLDKFCESIAFCRGGLYMDGQLALENKFQFVSVKDGKMFGINRHIIKEAPVLSPDLSIHDQHLGIVTGFGPVCCGKLGELIIFMNGSGALLVMKSHSVPVSDYRKCIPIERDGVEVSEELESITSMAASYKMPVKFQVVDNVMTVSTEGPGVKYMDACDFVHPDFEFWVSGHYVPHLFVRGRQLQFGNTLVSISGESTVVVPQMKKN